MRNFIALTALACLAATPSFAAETETRTKDDSKKVICKGQRVLGSNLSQRTCKTKEQWEYERRQAKDALDFNRPVPEITSPIQGGG